MKFSDAAVLGTTICPMDGGSWQTCLIGVAWQAEKGVGARCCGNGYYAENATERWPWLLKEFDIPSCLVPRVGGGRCKARTIISHFALEVGHERMPLETAIQWIRSVEPTESPDLDTEAVPELALAR
jgi:hypothetical protein